jgi:hypothetical protein
MRGVMIFAQSSHMNRSILLFLAFYLCSSISSAETDFLCFSEPEYPQERICYPLGTNPDKAQTAMEAILRLAENLSSPIDLIALEGEMRESYDDEKITSALNEYYTRETLEGVYQLLTLDKYTYVLLKDGSALLYDHEINKIVFGFDTPTSIIGAQNYYGNGSRTKVETLRPTESNCNLQKRGIYFLSPPKESFFYHSQKSVCGYGGHFFYRTEDNEVKIGRFDQIGQGWITLWGDFHKFLLWMNE